MKILLGVAGSVAAKLTTKLILALETFGEVRTMATKSAEHFIPLGVTYYKDEDEWTWRQKGDIILHIDLRSWADVVLAPLSANTLSKISQGAADNLYTNTIRAWDYRKPMILVPVMNEMMWINPFTEQQLMVMRKLGARVIDPVVKTMMCGETGKGAMPEIDNIVKTVRAYKCDPKI
jgi:phosphopantothenoylcysteine decarboxylase